MTYLGFHLTFILGPTVVLTAVALRSRARLGPRTPAALFAVAPLALLYTARWDQYLIANRVWWYGEDRVVGSWLGVPYEEYAFMMLQPVLTGALLLALLSLRSAPLVRPSTSWHGRRAGAAAGSALILTGLGAGAWALRNGGGWTYLGLILVWALPALGGLVVASWPGLRAFWRESLLTWAVATTYLGVADGIAIASGVWTISPEQSTGWLVFGLPFEEALFFAVTNGLVVAGAMLFWVPGLPPAGDGIRSE
ncbi:MAG: hypothetical protein AMS19_01005 [Gemmatimonas sp. SG8_23]|nr:MAG: hypothetical protein AMS19_01005 [Gemmatimonas sp. SG8_23]